MDSRERESEGERESGILSKRTTEILRITSTEDSHGDIHSRTPSHTRRHIEIHTQAYIATETQNPSLGIYGHTDTLTQGHSQARGCVGRIPCAPLALGTRSWGFFPSRGPLSKSTDGSPGRAPESELVIPAPRDLQPPPRTPAPGHSGDSGKEAQPGACGEERERGVLLSREERTAWD